MTVPNALTGFVLVVVMPIPALQTSPAFVIGAIRAVLAEAAVRVR